LKALPIPAGVVSATGRFLTANATGEPLMKRLADSLPALLCQQPAPNGTLESGSHTYRWQARPIPDDAEKRVLVCFLHQPRTEISAGQLAHLDRLASLGRTMASLVHELNGPLTTLTTSIDLLVERDPHNHHHLLADIHRSGRRARNLARRILSFARPGTSGRADLCPSALVSGALDLVQAQARSHNIELSFTPTSQRSLIKGDEIELRQVLVNLLTNAIQALSQSPAPRCVSIATGYREPWVAIDILDSGPGIDQDTLLRIFDPFYTTKSAQQGTGLGLHIARRIVEAHQGRLLAKSEVGEGTTFTLLLPPSKAAPGRPRSGAKEVRGGLRPGLGTRVLVVDDDQTLVRLLQDILSEAGYSVATARSGSEALRTLKRQDFDLILSDLRMPEMSGVEFYRIIAKENPRLARRIAFVTGDVVSQETSRFFAETHAPHLAKPFRIQELDAVLTQMRER
jgi:signal transduction histidine kinase